MTKEEYTEKLEALQAEYDEKEKELKREFALSNSIAKVNDMIKGAGATLKVQSVDVAYWLQYPQCVYHGIQYTNKGAVAKMQHVSERMQSQVTHVNGKAVDLF